MVKGFRFHSGSCCVQCMCASILSMGTGMHCTLHSVQIAHTRTLTKCQRFHAAKPKVIQICRFQARHSVFASMCCASSYAIRVVPSFFFGHFRHFPMLIAWRISPISRCYRIPCVCVTSDLICVLDVSFLAHIHKNHCMTSGMLMKWTTIQRRTRSASQSRQNIGLDEYAQRFVARLLAVYAIVSRSHTHTHTSILFKQF